MSAVAATTAALRTARRTYFQEQRYKSWIWWRRRRRRRQIRPRPCTLVFHRSAITSTAPVAAGIFATTRGSSDIAARGIHRGHDPSRVSDTWSAAGSQLGSGVRLLSDNGAESWILSNRIKPARTETRCCQPPLPGVYQRGGKTNKWQCSWRCVYPAGLHVWLVIPRYCIFAKGHLWQ